MSPAAARRFGVACLLATLAAALLLAATGAGEARAKADSQRFWATFRAEKTIGWVEPRRTGLVDCYHSWWTSAEGRQVERYASTKPIKALVTRAGLGGGSIFLKWRTWDLYDQGSPRPMPGMGAIDRSASRAEDWEAGTCGVRGVIVDDEGRERETPVPPKPGDCGVKRPAVEGSLFPDGKRVTFSVYATDRRQAALMGGYRSCELRHPYDMDEITWGTEVSAPFPRKALFDPSVPVVQIKASRQYHQKLLVGGGSGLVIANGDVRWTVTLRRAGVRVVKGRGRR